MYDKEVIRNRDWDRSEKSKEWIIMTGDKIRLDDVVNSNE